MKTSKVRRGEPNRVSGKATVEVCGVWHPLDVQGLHYPSDGKAGFDLHSQVFSSTAHKVGKKRKVNHMPRIEPETYTLSRSFNHQATHPGSNHSPFLSL